MRENVGFADETRVDTRHLQHLVARKPWLADFAFLIRSDADIEALLDAEHEAGQSGVDLLTALFTVNRITPHRYTEALAAVLEIPAAGYDISFDQNGPRGCFTQPGAVATPIFGYWRGTPALIVCATDAFPRVVATRVASARSGAPVVVLVAARPLQSAVELACAAINVKAATFGLKRSQPLFSAGRAGPQWQPIIIAVGIGLVAGSATANPQGTLAIFTLLLTVPFLGTVLVRLMALVGLLFRSPGLQPAAPRIPDRELPIYSFMVALYDEADVLPTLIAALTNLDYPATKLDGLLVIEDGDFATKAALLEIALPAFMRVVVVPDGELRTKPRALNYALALARGVYVVIYDAEDRPEPDQLRRALAAFRTAADTGSGTQQLACVQACLNIYNARQSWLTRQFTVEYSALFDSVLPTLQRLRMPMPLGGTSNHFPRRVLAELRGWDPYNVTEDADLGIRIARLGHRVTMISSTTWEEAPATFNLWLKQRTR